MSNNRLERSTNNNNDKNNSTSQSINQNDKNNNFRYGLTMGYEILRDIYLNHIPQRLNNQFNEEFTYNVLENTNYHDPIVESNLVLDIYSRKDIKFTKRCTNMNNKDKSYLEDTSFKFSLEFAN